MSDTSGDKYEKGGNLPSETKEDSEPAQKKTGGWPDLAKELGKLWLPRLILVLLFVDYGVIAFSKGENGVHWDDFWVFVAFVAVSVLMFILLVVLKTYWSQDINKKQILKKISNVVNRNNK